MRKLLTGTALAVALSALAPAAASAHFARVTLAGNGGETIHHGPASCPTG